jgi:hypothetical protein
MTEEPGAPRHWRVLDSILLIASTAVAMLPVKDRWPEVLPVVRQLEITRLLDDTYWKELFRRQIRVARTDSVRVQLGQIFAPALGLSRFIEADTSRLPAGSDAGTHDLAVWAWMHALRGALGFALAQDGYFLVFPFLVLWSLCLLVLRLIRPRPAWSDLLRQPGWWACFSSIVGIALESLLGHPVPSVIVPVIVLVAWVALVGSGKVKAEASCIDRAGRLLGVLWLLTIPVYLVGFVFSKV